MSVLIVLSPFKRKCRFVHLLGGAGDDVLGPVGERDGAVSQLGAGRRLPRRDGARGNGPGAAGLGRRLLGEHPHSAGLISIEVPPLAHPERLAAGREAERGAEPFGRVAVRGGGRDRLRDLIALGLAVVRRQGEQALAACMNVAICVGGNEIDRCRWLKKRSWTRVSHTLVSPFPEPAQMARSFPEGANARAKPKRSPITAPAAKGPLPTCA